MLPVFLVFLAFAICIGGGCILRLRKTHPTEIYVVWYAFSFFFVAFFFLGAYARIKHITVEDIFRKFPCGDWAYNSLTDWSAEFLLILIFLGLVALPQWLAYFLSGLSGSATRPKFVWQAHDVAIWSLIKTVASLSGIALAGFFWTKFDLPTLFHATGFLSASFVLLACRCFVFSDLSRKATPEERAAERRLITYLITFRWVRDFMFSMSRLFWPPTRPAFRAIREFFTRFKSPTTPADQARWTSALSRSGYHISD